MAERSNAAGLKTMDKRKSVLGSGFDHYSAELSRRSFHSSQGSSTIVYG